MKMILGSMSYSHISIDDQDKNYKNYNQQYNGISV
jgi:hypothetical protein